MDSGDAVVIARCRGADEYARTSVSKNWNYHWYLILKAVADFEAAHNVSVQKAVNDTTEDAGDTWILHRRDGWGTNAGSWLYRVDKKTLAVQAIP